MARPAGPADEFLLDPRDWPAMPAAHRTFLERALPRFRDDTRLSGLAASGSFAAGTLDEHSDLDLVVVARPEALPDVLRTRQALAQRLGSLLAAFPGDHIGEPQILISLYGPPLLHVDLNVVSTKELADRVDHARVIWDRDGAVRAAAAAAPVAHPQPRLQWIEDRFWVWIHYIAVKIARGEIFEAIDGLAFVRGRVLGPLVLTEAGAPPYGVRRVEQRAPDRVAALRAVVAAYDRDSCRRALAAAAALYLDLRARLAPPDLVRRTEAERAVKEFIAHA
jgi:predicted nucleotidyltransferase